jgi:elongation factor P
MGGTAPRLQSPSGELLFAAEFLHRAEVGAFGKEHGTGRRRLAAWLFLFRCLHCRMQTILPSEFKRQMVVMLDGSPHVIEDMHTSGTAQTRHKLHTRLRHLTTGRVIDRVFADNERVPVAPLETRRATYGYAQGDTRIFTDIETFEEFEFSDEQLGERRWFLKENEEYKALRLDGRLLDIVLPPQISLKVVDTAPAARGGLSASWKEAKLETGLEIMVPLFIANGDIIRIDTAEKKYLGKDTSGE